jgi:phospholipid N-methyltransferase
MKSGTPKGVGHSYLEECRAFYQQFRRQYYTTGSILPSSRSLARALASEVRRRPGPARVLEVGPGTGSVTAEILRPLGPGDWLDIVEINADFLAVLRRRFEEEPLFRSHWHQVQLIHSPLQEVEGEGIYDYMISGLPLNNFPLSLVQEIFASYERLLRPGGVLSYFEYMLVRQIKALFVGTKERERLRELGAFLEGKIRAHQFREDHVYFNITPAVARHFRFTR